MINKSKKINFKKWKIFSLFFLSFSLFLLVSLPIATNLEVVSPSSPSLEVTESKKKQADTESNPYSLLEEIIAQNLIHVWVKDDSSQDHRDFRNWILAKFSQWGFDTSNSLKTTQEVPRQVQCGTRLVYTQGKYRRIKKYCDETVIVNNLEFTLPGQSSQVIAIGAHYDLHPIFLNQKRVPEPNQAFFDNRSGVALLMALAYFLKAKDVNLPFTIKFLFWDAEEHDLLGSKVHVEQNSQDIQTNYKLLINMDSMAGADNFYYGVFPKTNLLITQLITLLQTDQYKDQIQPSFPNSDVGYSTGSPHPWSDHQSYREAGIPVVVLENTNYDIGDQDGYANVDHKEFEDTGYEIWHTKNDNLKKLNNLFPGRVKTQLLFWFKLLQNYLLNVKTETQLMINTWSTLQTFFPDLKNLGLKGLTSDGSELTSALSETNTPYPNLKPTTQAELEALIMIPGWKTKLEALILTKKAEAVWNKIKTNYFDSLKKLKITSLDSKNLAHLVAQVDSSQSYQQLSEPIQNELKVLVTLLAWETSLRTKIEDEKSKQAKIIWNKIKTSYLDDLKKYQITEIISKKQLTSTLTEAKTTSYSHLKPATQAELKNLILINKWENKLENLFLNKETEAIWKITKKYLPELKKYNLLSLENKSLKSIVAVSADSAFVDLSVAVKKNLVVLKELGDYEKKMKLAIASAQEDTNKNTHLATILLATLIPVSILMIVATIFFLFFFKKKK